MYVDPKTKVLFYLLRHGYVGGKHTSEEKACSGFPKHGRKKCKEAIEELKRDGYLIPKTTGYGSQISINPKMTKRIKNMPKIKKLNKELYPF